MHDVISLSERIRALNAWTSGITSSKSKSPLLKRHTFSHNHRMRLEMGRLTNPLWPFVASNFHVRNPRHWFGHLRLSSQNKRRKSWLHSSKAPLLTSDRRSTTPNPTDTHDYATNSMKERSSMKVHIFERSIRPITKTEGTVLQIFLITGNREHIRFHICPFYSHIRKKVISYS